MIGAGIPEVWGAVEEFRAAVATTLADVRASQNRDWMWSEVTDSLLDALAADGETAVLARQLEVDVAAGRLTPTKAARTIVQAFLATRRP